MKKVYTIIIAASLAISFYSCGNSEDQSKVNEDDAKVSSTNPNQDSELALLMRAMFLEGEKIRDNIISGEGGMTETYLKMIEQGHTATPTDPEVKTAEYTDFNNVLLADAKAVMEAEDVSGQFNKMVNSCMECHEVFCPGPTRRIKKLYISDKLTSN